MEDDFDEYDLPVEDDLAFVKLERKYRRELDRLIAECENGNAVTSYQYEFMNRVLAAARALEIEYFAPYQVPSKRDWQEFERFEYALTSFVEITKIRASRRRSKFSVRLTDQEKGSLHELIGKIRTTVQAAEISAPKKEAIFKKLAALAAEIDRDRTGFEAFADFAAGIARVSGDFAREGAEPWWKWIRPIFEILGAAKEEDQKQPRLPPRTEQKKLEPPKPPRPKPDFDSDLDDDVPF